jgi:hypothetical protein
MIVRVLGTSYEEIERPHRPHCSRDPVEAVVTSSIGPMDQGPHRSSRWIPVVLVPVLVLVLVPVLVLETVELARYCPMPNGPSVVWRQRTLPVVLVEGGSASTSPDKALLPGVASSSRPPWKEMALLCMPMYFQDSRHATEQSNRS